MSYSPMGDLSVLHQLNDPRGGHVREIVSSYVIVSGGVTLFFAPEKAHKTFWALQMALSGALGVDFLTLSAERGKVLYVTFEGGKPYLLARIEDMARALYPDRWEEALGWVGVEDLRGSQLDVLARPLEDLVVEHEPLYLFCDPVDLALSGDYSNPKVARSCMGKLIELAEKHDLGVVAVTHSRKDARRGFDDAIGSKMWLAMAATVIRMALDARGTRLEFEVRYGPPVQDISVVFNPSGFFEATQRLLKEGERARQAIMELVAEAGGKMPWKELKPQAAERAGVHPNTIDSARHRLEQERKIQTVGIKGSAAKEVILL